MVGFSQPGCIFANFKARTTTRDYKIVTKWLYSCNKGMHLKKPKQIDFTMKIGGYSSIMRSFEGGGGEVPQMLTFACKGGEGGYSK